MWAYMKRSSAVIIRSFMMYKPLRFFGTIGALSFLIGFAFVVRFLVLFFTGTSGGHVQSLVLAAALMMIGVQAGIAGLQADMIAANRKILEDIQYRVGL